MWRRWLADGRDPKVVHDEIINFFSTAVVLSMLAQEFHNSPLLSHTYSIGKLYAVYICLPQGKQDRRRGAGGLLGAVEGGCAGRHSGVLEEAAKVRRRRLR
uniref:Uncharacterized protein n=1 Tax=Hanusia phi TaxID=3032 RepID=A0A7S0EGB6_9CRYP